VRIYIPTYKRVGKQTTLKALPPAWKLKTWLVVRPEEAKAHEWPRERILVCDKKGVPAARQAACEHALAQGEHYVFMFDDDLRFAVRPAAWKFPHATKLRKATEQDIQDGINRVGAELASVPKLSMLGFDARGGNQTRAEPDLQLHCRVMRAFGVNAATLRTLKIRFDAFPFWEDFHVALSLIRHGHAIGNLMRWTNDAGTNTAGGCSTYRNVEALRECQTLFALEHKHAKPVLKKPKSWGGELGKAPAIPDFVIYWQKAVKEAHARHLARRR
jgi:hypothetical protein